MDFKEEIVKFSVSHYKLITILVIIFTMATGALIPLIKVDTDPENMLSEEEAVRIFHNQTKRQFELNDMVVVGIVNDKSPLGAFSPSCLKNIYDLTEFSKTLT